MIAPHDIVTFHDVHGYEIIARCGTVSGSAYRPKNRLRSTIRSLGMLVGVTPNEFLSDAEHLRGEALAALSRRADAVGANAVIGLTFRVSEGNDGSCNIVAHGEAVRLRPSDERA